MDCGHSWRGRGGGSGGLHRGHRLVVCDSRNRRGGRCRGRNRSDGRRSGHPRRRSLSRTRGCRSADVAAARGGDTRDGGLRRRRRGRSSDGRIAHRRSGRAGTRRSWHRDGRVRRQSRIHRHRRSRSRRPHRRRPRHNRINSIDGSRRGRGHNRIRLRRHCRRLRGRRRGRLRGRHERRPGAIEDQDFAQVDLEDGLRPDVDGLYGDAAREDARHIRRPSRWRHPQRPT